MIDLLRVYVRNALAMSFDDSLSPTEFMAAVVAKVNEMINALNTYLETDVSATIISKIEEMETDGTLETIINGIINTELTDARSSTVKGVDYENVDARLEALESDLQGLSVDASLFGAIGDGTTDDTEAIQAAIDFCLENNCDLSLSKLCKITESLIIDRAVDDLANDHYFTIFSNNRGGLYVTTPIAMISSSYAFTTAPVCQMVKFRNLQFVASVNTLSAYVLDDSRFLRTVFDNCTFSKIKCLYTELYTQSIYLLNCNARRVSGTFFLSPLNYDLQVIGGLYESIAGNCFDVKVPVGCKINCMIEGVSGTALLINGAQGIDICVFMEQNGYDIDSRTGGEINRGINIHGSYFSHNQDNNYSIKWGSCEGCVSHGNWHTNNMHDLQADSVVDINDIAQTNISNTGLAVQHTGYRENGGLVLEVRSDTSASYTVSNLSAVQSRIGNRVQIDFKCTITSTGTNSEAMLYIPGTFEFESQVTGVICGHVQVKTTGLSNDGISPLFIADDSPFRVKSVQNVIPANTSGNNWAVIGQISYMAVPVAMPT